MKKRMKRWPLSVSSDRIAVTALRCAGLLSRLGIEDRGGAGGVYEVYPAAALAHWGLPHRNYKEKKGAKKRKEILEGLLNGVCMERPSDVHLELLIQRDDALDALVCAIVARAAGLGLTQEPPKAEAELAQEEGWIHVPTASLDEIRMGKGP